MSFKKIIFLFFGFQFQVLLFTCFLLTACAIRQQPDGGAKDLIPPKIIRIIPENYSTNFSSKEVRITFDEYIELKELSKQLVISPLMSHDPDVSIKNKTLIIKLPDSLRQNTTYTMNFGNSIVDSHEANPLADFQYVFSTGPELDSLEVKGEIKFAENLKTEKGIIIMLYNNLSDTVVYKTLPDYFAKTDSAGNFLIKNLRAGTYKLFALKDGNANYKFDSKNEAIGFASQTINVPDSESHSIRMFIEPDTLPQVLKAQFVSPGKAILVFTAPVKDFKLQLLSPADNDFNNLIFERGVVTDTVYVYCIDTLTDSLNAVVFNGDVLIDTIHVNLKSMVTSRGRGDLISPALDINTNLNTGILEMPPYLLLNFSVPVKLFDTGRLKFMQDSVNPVPFTAYAIDSLQKNYRIDFQTKENKAYTLLIPSNAATDIFNHRNDSILINFRTREDREYANVILAFTTVTKGYNYLVQLLSENDAVVKQTSISQNQKLEFNHVQPGKYKIRIIDDVNKNGKWDNGNYWRKTQPEIVFYYPELITTRANWDVDLNWILK